MLCCGLRVWFTTAACGEELIAERATHRNLKRNGRLYRAIDRLGGLRDCANLRFSRTSAAVGPTIRWVTAKKANRP